MRKAVKRNPVVECQPRAVEAGQHVHGLGYERIVDALRFAVNELLPRLLHAPQMHRHICGVEIVSQRIYAAADQQPCETTHPYADAGVATKEILAHGRE